MPDPIAPFHNAQEALVLAALDQLLPHHPHLSPDQPENTAVLADIACVALNRLPPRYIRHVADLAFYQTPATRGAAEEAAREAVEYAIGFVVARNALGARR